MSPSISFAARRACWRSESASALYRGPSDSRRSQKALVSSTTENSLALSFWLISVMLAKKMSLPTLAIFVSGLEVRRRFGGHRQVEFRELLRGLGDMVARVFQFIIVVLRQRRRSGRSSEERRLCGKAEGNAT